MSQLPMATCCANLLTGSLVTTAAGTISEQELGTTSDLKYRQLVEVVSVSIISLLCRKSICGKLDSFFPRVLQSCPKGAGGNPRTGSTSPIPAHLNPVPGSAHLCPTFSQVLGLETVIGFTGVVSSIFSLFSLNAVTNIQIKGATFFRKKLGRVNSYRKGSFCSPAETSKRKNHMRRRLGHRV